MAQYSVIEEVVISAEQENQILELMNAQNSQGDNKSVIHFIQNDSPIKQDPDQHIVYVEDPNAISPLYTQYQIAELDTLEYNEAMHFMKLDTDQILQEVDACIDMEHLLREPQDVPGVEHGKYVS